MSRAGFKLPSGNCNGLHAGAVGPVAISIPRAEGKPPSKSPDGSTRLVWFRIRLSPSRVVHALALDGGDGQTDLLANGTDRNPRTECGCHPAFRVGKIAYPQLPLAALQRFKCDALSIGGNRHSWEVGREERFARRWKIEPD